MFFDELSNSEWDLLAPVVSDKPDTRQTGRGRPRSPPRAIANAALWILTTGEPWSNLPPRYPSVPTCRRRFGEWLVDGTLSNMIRLLSRTGRKFASLQSSSTDVTSTAQRSHRTELPDTPRVIWRSPQSWQSLTATADGAVTADAFEEITSQLAGCSTTAFPCGEQFEKAGTHQPHRTGHISDFMWMGLRSLGARVTDRRGYVIYGVADPIAGPAFRAWAEITHHGTRVARSGLVGPHFIDSLSARQYALDWGIQWIDQQCPIPVTQESIHTDSPKRDWIDDLVPYPLGTPIKK
ncbi:transposase [Paraburkholderia sediminicola]|uniref:transposase n=1 Tax=Paraburkholderia sediminicola TaxID=458836 RepID=UPI0038B77E07